MLQQDLGEEAVLERDVTVGAGIAHRPFGDAGQAVGVVIAAVEHAGARRRTERRGVHVVEAQAVGRQGIEVGGGDRAAVATELPEARVIEHQEQHIGGPLLGPVGHRPGGGRYIGGAADYAGERGTGLVFVERHRSGREALTGP